MPQKKLITKDSQLNFSMLTEIRVMKVIIVIIAIFNKAPRFELNLSMNQPMKKAPKISPKPKTIKVNSAY